MPFFQGYLNVGRTGEAGSWPRASAPTTSFGMICATNSPPTTSWTSRHTPSAAAFSAVPDDFSCPRPTGTRLPIRRSPCDVRRIFRRGAPDLLPLVRAAPGVPGPHALFYPFRYVFEFDTDEGINAMFTLLLAFWFRLFGLRVVVGRALVFVLNGVDRRRGPLPAPVVGPCGGRGGAAVLLPLAVLLRVQCVDHDRPAFDCLRRPVVRLPGAGTRSGGRGGLSCPAPCSACAILTKAFTVILVPLWALGLVLALRHGLRLEPRRLRSLRCLF